MLSTSVNECHIILTMSGKLHYSKLVQNLSQRWPFEVEERRNVFAIYPTKKVNCVSYIAFSFRIFLRPVKKKLRAKHRQYPDRFVFFNVLHSVVKPSKHRCLFFTLLRKAFVRKTAWLSKQGRVSIPSI